MSAVQLSIINLAHLLVAATYDNGRPIRPKSAYESQLRDECRKEHLRFSEHLATYVSWFEDKQLLKTLMLMWNMDDNLENLTDAKFKAKLQEIAEKPKNEVDPDLHSLFHGVEFDMGIRDVTQHVAQFMTKCDERIHLRGANDMMRADKVRKRVYMPEQQTNWERWGAGAGKRMLSKSVTYSKMTKVAQGTKAKDASQAV
ncbi:hypothetical protein DYB32_004311 [Aphanomyces invadans]|uniref:Uncharacterized protein n=1 Tax=Aphanomyces invadans TaxID=157072 RepID=A0A3R6Z515_9STRA|nr:hypothetical protein DYB32_004311 [Aphanomyces invadans]